MVLQPPVCQAPHPKTLRSLSPTRRHRSRSPEERRKSHRRHSRRCSKTLYKASPEARSSPPPSQPLQMLSFLSARGVVSIHTASSVCLGRDTGGRWRHKFRAVYDTFQFSGGQLPHWFQTSLLITTWSFASLWQHSAWGLGGERGRGKTKTPRLFIGSIENTYWSPE